MVESDVGNMGSFPGFVLKGWGKSEVDTSDMEGPEQYDSVQWASCSFKAVV